jgi:putative flippase GtrA
MSQNPQPLPVPCSNAAAEPDQHRPPAVVDIVVPVFNEEDDLDRGVRRLHQYLHHSVPFTFQITIADNASTDNTLAVAAGLAAELDHVRVIHLTEKGRGRALRAAWSSSRSPLLAYMDVDMSTDLAAVLPLLAPLLSGHSDIAIGTRFAHGARVVRGMRREAISRSYNLLLHATLGARFSDAQCGFKAIRTDVAAALLPLVEDPGWFFDTELLILAQRTGLRIHEVPVDWVDDPDSRVEIVPTAVADLRGIARMGRAFATRALPLHQVASRLGRPTPAAARTRRRPAQPPTERVRPGGRALPRQLLTFAVIGVISTLAYLALFAVLRAGLSSQVANALALVTTTIANTAANRRITFGITGQRGRVRHQAQGLIVFALGLALTSGALAGLHAVIAEPSREAELTVVTVANLAATVLRFILLRLWMYQRRRGEA